MRRTGFRIALLSAVVLLAPSAFAQGADLSLARGHFGDFNGDGRDDVLLRHASGSWSYYPMDGRRRGEGAGGAAIVRDRSWLFAGIGDFNGDGNDDVLLRHVDGRWRYFAMNGREVLADQTLQGLTVNTQWHFAAVGDFNGDGFADVLLRHDNGRWHYYPTRNGAVIDGAGRPNMTRNLAWRFAGVGDLNGDGNDDVLLRQEDGRWFYYPLEGRLRQDEGSGTASLGRDRAWRFAGLGDLNGDGNDDVLLRHEDGRWFYYPMQGRRRLAGQGEVALDTDTKWALAGMGDLNGDGKADVLLRHEDGRWRYRPMDGGAVLPGGGNASITRDLAWRGLFQRSTVAGRATNWAEGVFADADSFRALCAVPRTGFDAEGRTFPDVQGTVENENNWLRSWSNDTYLWYDEILDVEPACCTTPDYFRRLRTLARTPSGAYKDRFHFTENTARRRARVSSGITAGYGARFAVLAAAPPRLVRIAYTEPYSPAAEANLERGATILEVDGVSVEYGHPAPLNAGLFPSAAGETHWFTVRDLGATDTRTVAMTSAAVASSPVQRVRVLETDSGPVGYFQFNSHIAPAERGLIDAVRELNDAEVTDLVLDLRYNGGGYLAIAAQAGYMIAGVSALGEVFSELQFNSKHPEVNPVTGARLQPDYFLSTSTGWFQEPRGQLFPNLNLSRVFILSGPRTCSASEAIINALRGIDVEVVLIGETTCGKPYGFYVVDNCGTSYSSVQFRGVNAAGFGDYADGFSPENVPQVEGVPVPGCFVADDFDHLLGDPAEARLAAALQYRREGTCPPIAEARRSAVDFERLDEAIVDPSPSSWGESIAVQPRQMPVIR